MRQLNSCNFLVIGIYYRCVYYLPLILYGSKHKFGCQNWFFRGTFWKSFWLNGKVMPKPLLRFRILSTFISTSYILQMCKNQLVFVGFSAISACSFLTQTNGIHCCHKWKKVGFADLPFFCWMTDIFAEK